MPSLNIFIQTCYISICNTKFNCFFCRQVPICRKCSSNTSLGILVLAN
nr:MAG TPA: coiled coil protein [Bacteriophage sp.]